MIHLISSMLFFICCIINLQALSICCIINLQALSIYCIINLQAYLQQIKSEFDNHSV